MQQLQKVDAAIQRLRVILLAMLHHVSGPLLLRCFFVQIKQNLQNVNSVQQQREHHH